MYHFHENCSFTFLLKFRKKLNMNLRLNHAAIKYSIESRENMRGWKGKFFECWLFNYCIICSTCISHFHSSPTVIYTHIKSISCGVCFYHTRQRCNTFSHSHCIEPLSSHDIVYIHWSAKGLLISPLFFLSPHIRYHQEYICYFRIA